MRVDIYRRAEANNKFSYLAVPEGRLIPEEATNFDWETDGQAKEMGENAESLRPYGINDLDQQIAEKGYAITSVASQPS